MMRMRRGVILGLVLGSLIGGTAGATILTASEHRENVGHVQVQPATSTSGAHSGQSPSSAT
jgi:hypothetical protein